MEQQKKILVTVQIDYQFVSGLTNVFDYEINVYVRIFIFVCAIILCMYICYGEQTETNPL